MSRNVDERVVEMQFDNAQFERNVKTSMNSIDQLKQSLDFNGVGGSISFVAQKFSVLETIAVGALLRIGSQAVDTGQRLIKSLTIDQISVGWEKFAEKTTSVQTIMAATRETWQESADAMQRATWLMSHGVDKTVANSLAQQAVNIQNGTVTAVEAIERSGGKATLAMQNLANRMGNVSYQGDQMRFVNEQLERLNWFTDETSYKLVDMASNIGKFTSAGVGLEKAVSAMEGIATWAAISGGNANSASIAMYNMSQALGSGAVLAVDWKSIENQNMATAEFKQIVIETAEQLGTLQKVSEGVYKTMDGNEVTVKNFRENLKDRWFSDEVLMGSLQKYGDFAVELQQVAAETDLSAKELLDSLTAYKDASLGMGEYLVNQGINDELANGVAERYKQIASGMMTMEEAAEELGTTPAVISNLTKRLDGFMDGAVDFEAMLEEIKETCPDTTLTIEDLRKEFNHLTDDTMDLGMRAFKAAQEAKTFQEAVDYVREAVSTGWLKTFEKIFGNYEEAKELWSNLAEEFYTLFVEAGDIRNSILDTWKKAGGRDDLVEAFWNIFHAIMAIVDAVKGAIKDVFNPILSDEEDGASRLWKWTNRLKEFSEMLKFTNDETGELNETGQKIKSTFKGIFAIFGIIGDVLGAIIKPIFKLIPGIGSLGSGVLDVTANFGDMLVAFRETINSSEFLGQVTEYLGQGFEFLGNIIGKIPGAVRTLIGYLPQVKEFFKGFTQNAGGYLSQVRDFFKSFGEIDLSGAQTFSDKVRAIFDQISEKFEKVKAFFAKVKPVLQGIGKFFGTVFYGIGMVLAGAGDMIGRFLKEATLTDVVNVIGGLAKAFMNFKLGSFLGSITEFPEKVNAFTEALTNFTKKIKEITKNLGNNIIKFAISIAILAGAVFLLSRIDIPSMIAAGTAIATLMYLMHVVTKDMGTTIGKDQKVSSGATQIIAFSVAILILAKALKKISDIEPTQMALSVGALGILILALYAVTDQLSKRGDKDIGGGLKQLMAIAAAVLILSIAIKRLSSLNLVQLGLGLAAVSVLIAELKWAMKGLSNNGMSGKQILASSLYIMAFATGIKKLAKVLVDLSSLQWDSLARGITGLTVVVGEVVIATKLLANNKNGAKALTSSAVGLLIFVGVIKLMSMMSWETIGKGLAAIAAAFATLAISAALMTPVIDTIVKFGKTFWKISVGILALAAAMMVFSIAAPLFYASAGLIGKGIVVLLGELITAIPKLISALVDSLYQSAADIIEFISATIGLICAAIRTRAQDIVDTVLDLLVLVIDGLAQRAEPIYEDLLEIFVFGFLDALGDKISESIPRLTENMKTIFDALTEALSSFGAGDMLETLEAVDTLEKIMWKLSVIAGMTWLASGTFPKIGTKLGEFGTNIMPFFRALQIVSPGQLVASKYLADMMSTMTSTGIKDALTSWFTGQTRLSDLGKELASFAPYFATYARNVKNIDAEKVIQSADALKALSDVWIPYIDSTTYDELGKGLESIGEKLGTYSTNVSNVSKDAVIASAEAITELSSALYNVQTVNTEDLALFAKGLVDFAPSLVEYGTWVSAMNIGAVLNSMVAANAVVDLALRIPSQSKNIFTGDKSLKTFGKNMSDFGAALVLYSGIVAGLAIGTILNSMIAANAIIDLALRIPSQSKNIFTGDKSLKTFGKNMSDFGAGLVGYFNAVSGIGFQRIIDSKEAADAIIDIALRIPNQNTDNMDGDKSLGTFGENMANFGTGLASYFGAIAGVGFQRIVDSADAAKEIIEIAKLIPSQSKNIFTGDKSLGTFGENMADFGAGFAGYFNAVSGIGFQRIEDSAEPAKKIIEIAKLIPSQSKNIFTGDKSLGLFGANMANFGTGLASYANAIAGIGFQRIEDSAEPAKKIIEIALLIPSQSKNIFTGDKSLGTFGQNMADFGNGLASYFGAIAGVGFQRIVDSIEPARALIEMGNSLGTGSLEGWLFGYKTFSDFGMELAAFGESLATLSDSLTNVDTTVFARVRTALNILSTVKIDELSPVLEQLHDLIDTVYSIDNIGASGHAEALATALSDLANTGIEGLATAFEDPERVAGAIDSLISNIDSAVSEKETDVEGIATDLANAFIKQMAIDIRNGKRTIGQAVSQLASHIRTYRNQFYQAGGWLVEGFAGGIDSNRWKAEAAARVLADKTMAAAREEMDENSPSKKGFEIGDYFGLGMVRGVLNRVKDAASAGKDLASETLNATNAVISRIADYVDSGMDTQPTIRPVLDLTDVTNGFGSLNAMFSRRQAIGISARMGNIRSVNGELDPTATAGGPNYNFVQNNYSPKALNASEIYRQTKNQFSKVKGWATRR